MVMEALKIDEAAANKLLTEAGSVRKAIELFNLKMR
jgi:hypothetical protein